MIIPPDQLSEEALQGLIEEFVTRDGTDLSNMEAKTARVIKMIERGRAVIHFDEEEGSCQIVIKDG